MFVTTLISSNILNFALTNEKLNFEHISPNSQLAQVINVNSPAELPRIYLDTTYQSSVSGVCSVTLASGANVQNAIDAISQASNYVICLQAGGTFGPFTLRNKIGSGWITIRTSTPDAQFIAPGVRVSPNDNALMAKILSPSVEGAISTESGAHNYRIVGLEITTTFSTRNSTLYNLVYLGNEESILEMTPTDIVIDRSYVHGTPTGNIRRGVTLNGRRMAVIDSYISDIHEVGSDSQAIGAWNGAGPFKIVNNYLEGSGENVMFGGSLPNVPGLIASDIEVRHNYFFKPLSWKINSPNYAGIPWSVKNLFELKNAQRVLLDGNIFENNWLMAQTGFAILFNGVDGPTSVIRDITFTNNIIKNSEQGLTTCSNCYNMQLEPTGSILIRNNIFDNVSGKAFQLLGGVNNLAFDHNTVLNRGTLMYIESPVLNTGFVFTNNIVGQGDYGLTGGPSIGTATLNAYFTDWIFNKNVIAGAASDVSGYYPAGNYFPSWASVAFTNYNSGAGGDYRLTSSSSYKNLATDGTDIGVDVDKLNIATVGVIAGNGTSTPPPPPPPPPTPTPTPTPPLSDTTPPTVPTNLSASTVSNSSVTLSWSPSTDNVGVVGYKINRNGVQVVNQTGTTYVNSGLLPDTTYTYAVAAYDLAGNQSVLSTPISVRTLAVVTPPSTKFSLGSRVQTTSRLKVRQAAGTTRRALCTQAKSALGTIIAGPVNVSGYTWWQINYDVSCDGWSVENYLVVKQ